jgi:uncharacterized protein (AIM24 family)
MTAFINQNNTKSKVSFASPYPGKIIPIDLTQFEENSFVRKILSFARPKVFLLESNSLKNRNWVIWWEGFIMQK